jgi:hypothetical protein
VTPVTLGKILAICGGPDFLAGYAEAIAWRIFARVSVDALQRRLWQGGSWPP